MITKRCGAAISAAVLLVAALLFFAGAGPARAAASMAQVAPGVGWAVQYGHLYWTNDDGANWMDITPNDPASRYGGNFFDRKARGIGGVFFLDASHGWVLLNLGQDSGESAKFDVASTADGGASWSLTRISAPSLGVGQDYGGGGEIFFLDSTHGWISLPVATTMQSRWAVLLAAADGGSTWSAVRDNRGAIGSEIGALRFVSTRDGWIAGGPDDKRLYVTHDGGETWNRQEVAPPAAVTAIDPEPTAQYDLPLFADAEHAVLPVTYLVRSRTGQDLQVLEVFSTEDGGRTWMASGTANLAEGAGVNGVDAVDSRVIVAVSSPGDGPELRRVIQIGRGGAVAEAVPSGASTPGNVGRISFVDAVHGWALGGERSAALFTTGDGGATWKDITPVKPHSNADASATQQASAATPQLIGKSSAEGKL